MGGMIGPSLYELQHALAVEKIILANLADTIGWDHPAQQSTRARIASLESVLSRRRATLQADLDARQSRMK